MKTIEKNGKGKKNEKRNKTFKLWIFTKVNARFFFNENIVRLIKLSVFDRI